MESSERDSVDDHVARWQRFWEDDPQYAAAVEGALVRMGNIVRTAKRRDVAAFDDAAVTFEDVKTLHLLMVQPYPTEATPAMLAEAADLTRAAMTSRLDRLVDAGLVTREAATSDRRRVLVRPTAAGRQVWERHVYEGMARERELLSALTLDELTRLNELLRKVVRSIER